VSLRNTLEYFTCRQNEKLVVQIHKCTNDKGPTYKSVNNNEKEKSFKKKGKAGEKFFEMYYLYLCRFHMIFM